MPDLNIETLRNNYELLISVACLALGGLCLLLGYVRMALDRRRLPDTSLLRIRSGPSRRSTLARSETWRSRSPLPWLSAVILLIAGTIVSWFAVTPDFLLMTVASAAIALAILSYLSQAKRRTTLTVGYDRVEIFRGGEQRAVEWKDAHAVRVSSDLSSFQVDGLSTTLDIDLRPFDAGGRVDIGLALLGYASLRGVEVTAVQPLRTNVSLFSVMELSHYVSFALAFLFAFLVSEQINLYGESNVLGLRCSANGAHFKERFQTPDRQGCVVLRVNPGSAAYDAGIKQGDLIVGLDSIPITSGQQFTKVFETRPVTQRQTYKIVRGNAEHEMKLRLGKPGEAMPMASDDPLYAFLAGRAASRERDGIAFYDEAIRLAPNFDLAYAYRAERAAPKIVFNGAPDPALDDANRAVQLDPSSSEALRARAFILYTRGKYDPALADIEVAMKLDSCLTAFKKYNYDCMDNLVQKADLLGAKGQFTQAAQLAVDAQAFYEDDSIPYYTAAEHFWSAKDLQNARKQASLFLLKDAGRSNVQLTRWAQGILSEQGALDAQVKATAVPAIKNSFLSASLNQDIKGPATVTSVRFATDKGSDIQPPEPRAALSVKSPQVWAYFEFANAPKGAFLSWRWSRGGLGTRGHESMNNMSNGTGWIHIDTNLPPANDGPGLLEIQIDGKTWHQTVIPYADDPFLGPAVFYEDPAATKPVLLYDGKRPVYLRVEYSNLSNTRIVWQADIAGRRVGNGDFVPTSPSGLAVIEIKPNSAFTPGLVSVNLTARDAQRSTLLAVAPPEVIAKPPLNEFRIGWNDGFQPSRLVSGSVPSVIHPFFDLKYEIARKPNPSGPPLQVQWMFDGKPFPMTRLVDPEIELAKMKVEVKDEKERTPKEVQIVVSQNDAPIYAETFVITR